MNLLIGLLMLVTCAAPATGRTWTDRTGKHAEASFVAFDNGKVSLKRVNDGKVFSFPLTRLGYVDQVFIEKTRGPVSKEMLTAYERAKQMICIRREVNQKAEVESLLKQLGFKIDSAPPQEKFMQCSWKPPLTKEMLVALQQSELVEYVYVPSQ